MYKKILITIFILISCIFSIGCQENEIIQEDEIAQENEIVTGDISIKSLVLNFDSGNYVRVDNSSKKFYLLDENKNKIDGAITINIYEPIELSIEEIEKYLVPIFKKLFDAENINVTQRNINNYDAIKIEVEGKMCALFFNREDESYAIGFATDTKKYDIQVSKFYEVLETIKFTD